MTPLNYNPHSLTQVTPNPTSSPSTQLFLVYNTYEYPHMEEEKDSRMAGFKLGVFDREAHLIGPQESCCSTIGRSQKAVWILAQITKKQWSYNGLPGLLPPELLSEKWAILPSKDLECPRASRRLCPQREETRRYWRPCAYFHSASSP